MEFDWEEFRKKFPHLHKELRGTEKDDSKRVGLQNTEVDSLSGYVPEAISYIRRARTDDEAVEIVSYLLRRGEILKEFADILLKQIEQKGVRSFGKLKTWGHYEKYRRKELRSEDEKIEDVSGEPE